MSRGDEAVELEVIQAISALLEQAGIPGEVPKDSSIADLGLESLAGLQFVCEIEERLGIDVPEELNPFVDDSKRRLRRVSEVIDFIAKIAR